MRKYLVPILILVLFLSIAVTLFLVKDNIFYLFNFSYIGISLFLGLVFFIKKKRWARNFSEFAIGLYIFIYLGIIERENMNAEGFWYYLFLGVFEGATIHYLIAKILGPFLFGRGWCGYACWSAMIFDLLPFKKEVGERKKLGFIRYIMFFLSLIFVVLLFFLKVQNTEDVLFYTFIGGNILYYAVGIALAFIFKDNRAFCKYICPVSVFMKGGSYFSLLRVHCDEKKCIKCGKCLKVCPMNVECNNDSRKRKNGTECILCYECVKACPVNALH